VRNLLPREGIVEQAMPVLSVERCPFEKFNGAWNFDRNSKPGNWKYYPEAGGSRRLEFKAGGLRIWIFFDGPDAVCYAVTASEHVFPRDDEQWRFSESQDNIPDMSVKEVGTDAGAGYVAGAGTGTAAADALQKELAEATSKAKAAEEALRQAMEELQAMQGKLAAMEEEAVNLRTERDFFKAQVLTQFRTHQTG